MQPYSAAGLSAFADEPVLGEWTFAVTSLVYSAATVERIAIRAYDDAPVLAVKDLACSADAEAGTVLATWTNGADYDEIQVGVNGTIEATLIGPFATGDGAEYSTATAGAGGSVEVSVTGVRGVLAAPAAVCEDFVIGTDGVEACGDFATVALPSSGSMEFEEAVTVDEDLVIARVEVAIRTGPPPFIDLVFSIESPAGTTIELLEFPNTQGFLQRVDVVFDDYGIPFGSESLDCSCRMKPIGPGTFEDLEQESSSGDWTIKGSWGAFPSLEEWCVRSFGCAVMPPSAVTCEALGPDVLIAWVNEAAYDEISILRDDVSIASLPGTAASFADLGVDTGRHEYRVVAYDAAADCSTRSHRCRTGVGFVEKCEENAELTTTEPYSATAIEFGESFTIAAVEVVFDAVVDATLETDLYLISPYGTELKLQSAIEDDNEFQVIWSNDGAPNVGNLTNFHCDFCLVRPAGPGSFADFGGEDSAGSWALRSSPWAADAEIARWCVAISEGCDAQAPGILTCKGGDDVAITWVPNDSYASLDLLRDGAVLATFGPGESGYTDIAPPRGFHTYELHGFNVAGDCFSRSRHCLANAGGFADRASDTEIALVAPDTVIDTVTITEPLVIGEVEVLIELIEPFLYSWDLHIESPFGTQMKLHEGGFGKGPFAVIWSDAGIPYASETGGFDCGLCSMQPSGPGTLAEFAGEIGDGVWALHRTGSGSKGIISRWCIALYVGCETPPPGNISCSADQDDILLEWTNSAIYTSIEIERDGVVVATLGAEASSHTDPSVLGGVYRYRVFGVSAAIDCRSGSLPCSIEHRMHEQCDVAQATISNDEGTEATIIFLDSIPIQAVEIRVDLSDLPVYAYDELAIESPEGTRVTLFDGSGSGGSRLDAMFSPWGAQPGPFTNYGCGCKIRPGAPEDLQEFAGEGSAGNWNLEISASPASFDATLNEWCVRVFEACFAAAPFDLSCADSEGDVTLSWMNGEVYDEILVERDEQLLATLEGSATSYADLGLDIGGHDYTVIGISIAYECAIRSQSCHASIGGVEACDSTVHSVAGDSSILDSTSLFLFAWPPQFIGETTVSIDLVTLGDADWQEVGIVSPAGTRVQLQAGGGGDSEGFRLTYSDEGEPNTGEGGQYLCDCLVQPSGPGQLADFDGESANGSWSLEFVSLTPGLLYEWCVRVVAGNAPLPAGAFLRGDANADGLLIGISDAIFLLQWTFGDGAEPPCVDAADVDGDNHAGTIGDAIYLLSWHFVDGPAPPAPGPESCGFDPGNDANLGCEDPPDCAE